MNILFLITARGGSKGVPKKNIIDLGNIPLLGYKAISAKKSNYCTRLILSSDSEEIAEVAKVYGVEVPFLRPKYLAADEANSIDVILHAMDWIEKNDIKKYDAICLLEPSSPFATYEDINNAVELFISKKALGVLSVKAVDVNSVFVSDIGEDLNMSKHFEKINSLNKLRRQDFKEEYTMNGAIYIADWDYFKGNKSFHSEKTYAYIMPEEKSVEIDTMNNLYYARFLIEKDIININFWK